MERLAKQQPVRVILKLLCFLCEILKETLQRPPHELWRYMAKQVCGLHQFCFFIVKYLRLQFNSCQWFDSTFATISEYNYSPCQADTGERICTCTENPYKRNMVALTKGGGSVNFFIEFIVVKMFCLSTYRL